MVLSEESGGVPPGASTLTSLDSYLDDATAERTRAHRGSSDDHTRTASAMAPPREPVSKEAAVISDAPGQCADATADSASDSGPDHTKERPMGHERGARAVPVRTAAAMVLSEEFDWVPPGASFHSYYARSSNHAANNEADTYGGSDADPARAASAMVLSEKSSGTSDGASTGVSTTSG